MTELADAIQDFRSYKQGLAADLAVEAEVKRDTIEAILALKADKDVLVLAHNYMSPLVYHLSDPDCRGDSLALARRAARTDRRTILLNGVRFMAETAKILNPHKKVLLADRHTGCSLADNLTADDVRRLRATYPGAPVVTYINSSAEVKAESDICCTSSNALEVIRSLAAPEVVFIPDSLMGQNLQAEIDRRELGIRLYWPGVDNDLPPGRCDVHERISVEDIRNIRLGYDIPKDHPRRAVIVHWECRPEVVAEADFCGSTSQMEQYVAEHEPERVFLGTECEMAANLRTRYPRTEFVRLCNVFCRNMALITLEKILAALRTEDMEYEITVSEHLRERALRPIERMLALAS